jgi:hypothetical protein
MQDHMENPASGMTRTHDARSGCLVTLFDAWSEHCLELLLADSTSSRTTCVGREAEDSLPVLITDSANVIALLLGPHNQKTGAVGLAEDGQSK